MFLRPWQVLQSRVFMFSTIQFNIDKNDSRAHECQLVFCTIISIYSFGSNVRWSDIMNIKMCINQQQIFNNLYCSPAKTISKGGFVWEKTSRLRSGQPGVLVSWDDFNFFTWEISSLFAGMNVSRVFCVLSLIQFDFSHSSATITLNAAITPNAAFVLSLSTSKSNLIKAICEF